MTARTRSLRMPRELRLHRLAGRSTGRRAMHGSAIVALLGIAVASGGAEPLAAEAPEIATVAASDTPPVVLSEDPSPKTPAISASGSVTDEAGEPIAGATVVLRGNWRTLQYSSALPHERDVLARTTTNAKGEFRFSNVGVPPRMTDVLDGLRQGRDGAQVIAWADGRGVQWQGINSFEAKDLAFRLEPEADVSGVISDEEGKPIANGGLQVVGYTEASEGIDGMYDDPGDLRTIRSEIAFNAKIENGRFTLRNLPRDYRVSVHYESDAGHRGYFVVDTGDGADREIASRIPGRSGTKVYGTPVRATVAQRPFVRIRVVDHEGEPVKFGGVEAIDSERHYGGSAAVGEDGIVVLAVNQPGVHEIHYASDPLHPAPGLMHSVDIQPGAAEIMELRLPATRSVTGRVVDSESGEGVPGVYINGGSRSEADASPRVLSATGVTNAEGRFELPVVEGEASFSIRHEVDGYFVPTFYSPDRDLGPKPNLPKVVVTANEVSEEPVIRIAKGLTIEGAVVDAEGKPAKGAKVTAANSDRSHYRQSATVADDDGRFRFEGFSPYVTTQLFASSEVGHAEQTIEPTADHPWEASLTKSVELKLISGTAVAGRVTQRGEPVQGVLVRLYRSPPEQPGEQSVPVRMIGETRTDAEGKYRLNGLRKGDRFDLQIELRSAEEFLGGSFQRRGLRTVGVEDGETIEMPDAEVKSAAQSLAGVVVDTEGEPMPGVAISAMLTSGEILSRQSNAPPPWTETDEQGRFKLTNLPDEPIELMAHLRKPGEQIRNSARVAPKMNAQDVRIIFDLNLLTEPESLD